MSKNLQTLLTKEMLEYEYELLGSMQKIADKLNVSVDSIYKYMKIYNINYDKHYCGIYSCNENIFSEENETAFYLAGFIAADGSLQKRKYSKILKITLSAKDKSHLEIIKLLLKSNHPIKEYKVKPSKKIKKYSQAAEIQIVSSTMFDSLGKFNVVPKKTLIYTMSDYIINHKMVHHFMRGYFDGDGCISYCGLSAGRVVKQLHFNVLGTKTFLNQFQDILLKNKIVNINKIVEKDNVFSLSYSGNNNASNIYDFLYKDATIFLDRKQNKFYNNLVATYSPAALGGDLHII